MDKHRDKLLQDVTDSFSQVKRALHSFAVSGLEVQGLSIAQHMLLRKIAESQPVSQAALAKQMQLTPGAISQNIDALDQANCIVRTANPSDRRISNLSVSQDGKAALDKFAAISEQLIARAFSGIPDEDIAAYVRVQRTIANWIESQHK